MPSEREKQKQSEIPYYNNKGFRQPNLAALRRYYLAAVRRSYLAALRRSYFAGRSLSWHHNQLLFIICRLQIVIPLWEQQDYTLISRRWHGGHSDDSHQHNHICEEREKAEGIFRLGLAADVSLAVWKALTGYICGSTAIIADAAHSASDVVKYSRHIGWLIHLII